MEEPPLIFAIILPVALAVIMLTHLARGDLALSVTMTAVSSVAAVFTVPLYLELAISHFGADVAGDPGMLGIVAKVFLITVLPLSLGMWVHSRWTDRIDALQGRMKTIAMAAFVAVVAAAVGSEFGEMKDNIAGLALATLALNVLAMSLSFTIARVARLGNRQATAIAMELGIHNSTVAIAVAATISTELAIPAAIYSAFMFVTAGAFAWVMSRRNAAAPATA